MPAEKSSYQPPRNRTEVATIRAGEDLTTDCLMICQMKDGVPSTIRLQLAASSPSVDPSVSI